MAAALLTKTFLSDSFDKTSGWWGWGREWWWWWWWWPRWQWWWCFIASRYFSLQLAWFSAASSQPWIPFKLHLNLPHSSVHFEVQNHRAHPHRNFSLYLYMYFYFLFVFIFFLIFVFLFVFSFYLPHSSVHFEVHNHRAHPHRLHFSLYLYILHF